MGTIKTQKVQRFYAVNKRKYAYAQAEKYGFDIFYIHNNEGMDRIFVGTKEEWEDMHKNEEK